MMLAPVHSRSDVVDGREAQLNAMIEYLRGIVLRSPHHGERFHAIFVDSRRAYLGDEAMGHGAASALTLRMRDFFSKALSVGASAIIIAHNHPSGDCRPSKLDIDATLRLSAVASALDIELLDHLIFTQSAVYSMRAGGNL
ncbi:MAG: JAB domain-containing protein [Pseudomonadota bacterium]